MNERHSEIDKYLLGVTIIIALVFGGGTGTGLSTDMAIQLMAVAASSFVCLRHMDRPIDRRVFWFLVLACLAIVLQILPVSTEQTRSTQGILPADDTLLVMEPISISLGLGRTIEVAGYFLTLCLFLTAVLKLRFEQVYGLIPFFLAGVVLNLTAGLIQYSYSGRAIVTDLFSYDLLAGFFVNVNHYSSLIFTSIPIAFVYFIETNRLFVLVAYIVAALLILLAAGSTAGVLIGFAITVLSIVILFQRSRAGILVVLLGTIILGIYSVGVWARLQVEEFNPGYGRLEFARTTLEGIRDNLPFGIGYGNFVIGYPSYEKSEMIFNTFVNHAHNEYLELVFEGGVIAAALLVIFFVFFLWRVLETIQLPLHKAATLAILFILVHSVVDYPLRTLGMAVPFTLFIAFLFHRGPDVIDHPKQTRLASEQQVTVEDII
ncbi:MAG: O-antigen ligase family protein [Hyphomicrobiales bacterium]|nr:O-antigen ligase family protein [Hyphomicrobiales bacterium]